MIRLILATRNRHKVQEIQAILGAGAECRSMGDYPGAPALVEDAETFEGNAVRKAEQLCDWLAAGDAGRGAVDGSGWVLADDSGLEVDHLGGAPGVLSARFAADEAGGAGNAPDVANNRKLLRLLEGVPVGERGARFRCVLALARVGGETEVFRGACEGGVALAPSGAGGFGYDPLFVPRGYSVSFAELGEATKNQISHRARALEALRAWMKARE